MKIAISVLSVALLAAVLLLWNRCDDGQDMRHETAEQHDHPSQTIRPSYNQDTPRERPGLPRLSSADGQDESAERVHIDRRPFDPAKESDSQHQRRVRLATAFDQFREESGISEKKAQAVLAVLHDFQETSRHVRKQHMDRIPYSDKREYEYKRRETSNTWRLVLIDSRDALEEILTPEELRAWNRTMEDASVWGLLTWPYEPPLIVPVE